MHDDPPEWLSAFGVIARFGSGLQENLRSITASSLVSATSASMRSTVAVIAKRS
jgi:hypothetical protein